MVLALAFFGIQMGNYGLAFWLPQILKDTFSADPWTIGLFSMIPWGTAAIAMVLWAYHSDRTGERRWHVALGLVLAGVTLSLGGLPGVTGWVALSLVTVTTTSVMCTQSTFWALPTAALSGAATAAGIAWINSVGNLAGYLSPFLVGRIQDTTGSMTLAYFVLGGSCLATSAVVLFLTRQSSEERRLFSSQAPEVSKYRNV